MTTYEELYSNYGYIISELEIAFFAQHGCSRESDLFLNFHDFLVPSLDGFMKKYNLPKNVDEHFRLVRGFITQYRRSSYYEGNVKNSYTKTNRENQTINIVSAEERKMYKGGISENSLISEVQVEEQVVQLEIQKRVEKGFNQFGSYLNSFEKVFFKCMSTGMSLSAIIRKVSDEGFDAPTYETAQRIKNRLEFRVTCFFAQEREILLDKRLVLKTLNKSPKLNKKAFGEAKLAEIPSQDQLEEAIRGISLKQDARKGPSPLEKKQAVYEYDKEATVQIYGKKYFAKSKIDFNGKKHDHWVVYINHALEAYDHTTKQTKKLV